MAPANLFSAPAKDQALIPRSEKTMNIGEKQSINPNLESSALPVSLGMTNFKKTQQYYDDLDINMDDLDKIEDRISEMEEYIGIQQNNELDYFVKNDIEKLDVKCNRLDDFIKVIEDKNFLLNDLFVKYDQLENFMKNGNKFTS